MDLLEVFKDSEDRVVVPAGALIIREGDDGSQMYVVMKGELVISLKNKILATAGPGEIVGEMAMINADIRSASVTAKSNCQLIHIDPVSFNSLLRHVPEFTLHMMNVLTNRLQHAYDMIEE